MPDLQNLCYNCFHDNPNPIGACPYCGYDNIENRAKYPIALKAGSILNGQYIVGRVLGQGGFGITYLALDYRLNIKVAIKEYIPDGMATRLPETTLVSVYAGEKKDNFYYGSERFLDEARILARFIGNKNITAVKCFFEENNTVYFVMDYIEGISFKNYIKNKGGRVDYTDALRVLLPVMDALAIVHEEGLIHRDVTPDNIYITKDNEIKLLDFGSARYSLGDKSKSLDVILKAGYAPKEQYLKRGKQGPYTDVYSLSACFYASITGFLPPEALERMEEDEIIPISGHGIRIPDHLEAAIMKGLAVRAENRWQNIAEFRSAILGEAASEEVQSEMEVSPVTDNRLPSVTNEPQFTADTPTIGNEAVTSTGTKDILSIGTEISTESAASPEVSQKNKTESKTREKEKKSSNKNKLAAVISAAACILLIVALIALINNRDNKNSANTDNSVMASNSESTSEASQTVIDTFSGHEETVTDTTEEDKAAAEKAAEDKAAEDKAAADKAAAEKAAADKAAADKAAADKAAAEKAAEDKAAEDKAAAEKAAEDKAAADKAAAEKAAAEKAAADKAAIEKAAAKKVAAEKAAAEKAAAKKAAAEKAAAEKAAECPYCDGTGKVECTWCEGTGISLETHQEDDGEYTYEGDPCPKKLTCDWCDGTGKR